MNLPKAVIAGSVAGVLGAAVWAGLAYGLNVEIGWIAWGIGLVVGVAVAIGSGEPSASTGVIAVIITVVSIVAGKYVAVQLMVSRELGDTSQFTADLEKPEVLTSILADEIVVEREGAGQKVNWPAGVNPEEAEKQSDYPPDIWQEAQGKWQAMSPSEQDDYKQARIAEVEAVIGSFRGAVADQGFIESFGLFDLVFFGLAVVTAFKTGASIGGDR